MKRVSASNIVLHPLARIAYLQEATKNNCDAIDDNHCRYSIDSSLLALHTHTVNSGSNFVRWKREPLDQAAKEKNDKMRGEIKHIRIIHTNIEYMHKQRASRAARGRSEGPAQYTHKYAHKGSRTHTIIPINISWSKCRAVYLAALRISYTTGGSTAFYYYVFYITSNATIAYTSTYLVCTSIK